MCIVQTIKNKSFVPPKVSTNNRVCAGINIFFDDIEIDSECMFPIVAFAISAGHNLKNSSYENYSK